MSKAYDVLMVEVGNMSKRQTTAVFDYIDELRAEIDSLRVGICNAESQSDTEVRHDGHRQCKACHHLAVKRFKPKGPTAAEPKRG